MSGWVSLSIYRFMQISLSRLNYSLRPTVTSCFHHPYTSGILQTKPHPQILSNIKLCFSILIQVQLSRLSHTHKLLTVSGCFHYPYICFALQNNRPPQVSFSIKPCVVILMQAYLPRLHYSLMSFTISGAYIGFTLLTKPPPQTPYTSSLSLSILIYVSRFRLKSIYPVPHSSRLCFFILIYTFPSRQSHLFVYLTVAGCVSQSLYRFYFTH